LSSCCLFLRLGIGLPICEFGTLAQAPPRGKTHSWQAFFHAVTHP